MNGSGADDNRLATADMGLGAVLYFHVANFARGERGTGKASERVVSPFVAFTPSLVTTYLTYCGNTARVL